MTRGFRYSVLLCAVVLIPAFVFAGEAKNANSDPLAVATHLIFQIGFIIIASRTGGLIFEKLKLPSVLGELLTGVIIGPYLLGSMAIPGFPEGLFPLRKGASMLPVSQELYAFATIASVILLFVSGLETDIAMFLRYSLAGAVVGAGGVLASFLSGDLLGMWFLSAPFMDPRCLFLGIVSTATSVGITARILSERRKIDSPEGVVILAGAVIDDVFGIICLAVVVGITATFGKSGAATIAWGAIVLITLKTFGIWLLFTILGLTFARHVGDFLKLFRPWVSFSIIALGLAFLLAGLFEKAGLSLIIGAYIVGLTLSKTDIDFAIRQELHPVYLFFVPIFFTVMGMLVDVRLLASPQIIAFGALYTLAAAAAKFFGCGFPALFLDFNLMGATRIGLGMIPRGEVALIIAGIGLSQGFLDNRVFGAAIVMTMLTTLSAPLLLDLSLRNSAKGTKKEVEKPNSSRTPFKFDSKAHAGFVCAKLVEYLKNEGFFVHIIETKERIVQVRKDITFFTVLCNGAEIVFEAAPEDTVLVKTIMYEVLLELYETLQKLKNFAMPVDIRKEIAENKSVRGEETDFSGILSPGQIVLNLKAADKTAAIEELVNILDQNRLLKDKDEVLGAVLQREASMSSGMQDGIALPHAKTDGTENTAMAVGISQGGIDFNAIDGKPCRIIILFVAPHEEPYIHTLASISALLKDERARSRLLKSSTPAEICRFFIEDEKRE
ncbi:MAG TPA: PTS transporter subunit EIIA [Deltaproteobacteria bacterium]|nr:PTS transporter subunit EIIA [Deltaproteobacteria bacterium]